MVTCTFENGNQNSLRHVTVDAIVAHGNKILLTKRAPHLTNPGKYALPGGYLSRDETTSQGAAREVLEETGYSVTIKALFKITDNPDRKGEDRQNVTLTFLAEAAKKTSEPDDEVTEVGWFSLDALPPEDQFAFDHFETVSRFKHYQAQPFTLPIL